MVSVAVRAILQCDRIRATTLNALRNDAQQVTIAQTSEEQRFSSVAALCCISFATALLSLDPECTAERSAQRPLFPSAISLRRFEARRFPRLLSQILVIG